jgi:hypothetical protein
MLGATLDSLASGENGFTSPFVTILHINQILTFPIYNCCCPELLGSAILFSETGSDFSPCFTLRAAPRGSFFIPWNPCIFRAFYTSCGH